MDGCFLELDRTIIPVLLCFDIYNLSCVIPVSAVIQAREIAIKGYSLDWLL